MKLLADECCDALLVAALRSDGHDVAHMVELARGSDDRTVLAEAEREGRLLLTEDKDFGELVVRLQLPAIGVMLLRIHPADTSTKIARMREVLQTHAERLTGHFVVIERGATRSRRLAPRAASPDQ